MVFAETDRKGVGRDEGKDRERERERERERARERERDREREEERERERVGGCPRVVSEAWQSEQRSKLSQSAHLNRGPTIGYTCNQERQVC